MPIRILIVDDHAIFRAGLRKLLEVEPDFEVIGETSGSDATAALARQLKPDVLLLDFAMPGKDGLAVLRDLRDPAEDTQVRVVMLTASMTRAQTAEALKAGAVGVLLKTAATELLYDCVRSVAHGNYWVGRETVGSLVEALETSRAQGKIEERPFGLTWRELEVVSLVSEGCSNREIAGRLRISEDTVKHHLSHAFDKTGTWSRVELALFAQRHRL